MSPRETPSGASWNVLDVLQDDGAFYQSALNRGLDTPMRAKVAIVGSAHTKREAPLNDPTWDVWTINNNAPLDRDGAIRADRWFEIHPPEVRSPERWEAMETIALTIPVYVRDPEEAGFGIAYPMAEILAAGFRDYFANSFAYMMALALHQGATTIGLFGTSLLAGSPRESTVEAACVHYWLGLAEGRGVELVIPRSMWGPLQHPWRYGDEDERLAVSCYTAARALVLMETPHPAAQGARLVDVIGR